jgi:hypothetical protein
MARHSDGEDRPRQQNDGGACLLTLGEKALTLLAWAEQRLRLMLESAVPRTDGSFG